VIYTSYFANYRKFPDDFRPVAISLWLPMGFIGPQWIALAPEKALLNDYKGGVVSDEEYTERYIKMLVLRRKLLKVELARVRDKNLLLLCYERPEVFCHRHIAREFLNREFEAGIEELSV